MLKIQVDLQEEYNILVCARHTADLRRKAKEGQRCFVQQEVKCHEELEYLIQQWHTKACAKQDKGMIPMTVLASSQEHQDFYHKQKNHYQTIANAYTNWYACQCTVSQTSNNTYYFFDPWDVDFEILSGAPEIPLNGFLNEN